MKKNGLLLLAAFCLTQFLPAQELNCQVQINTSKIQTTNTQLFENLQRGLNEFMNSRRWGNQTYAQEERIDCNFLITVQSYADNLFSTELQVQARRPIYNSSYNTSLLNFRDKEFNFTYLENSPIELNSSTYDSNLTAVLAYYAYIILGLDMDSYSKLGGTPYFRKAEDIVNFMQSSLQNVESAGWKAFDNDKNRYALVSNLMDERFRKFREFYYTYHRLCLDEMTINVENSRAKIAENISILRDINRMQPSAVLLIIFLDSKNDEIINIFSKHGTAKEKNTVYEIMTDVNPTLSSKYEAIKE